MNNSIMPYSIIFLVFTFYNNVSFADMGELPGPANHYQGKYSIEINEAVNEIIVPTREKAKNAIKKDDKIDLSLHGYVKEQKYIPLPVCASNEAYVDLNNLRDEYILEIHELLNDLNIRLNKVESEFARDVGKLNKTEQIYGKRKQLRKKVDEEYLKFEENIDKQNIKYDKKRDKIINAELESERCN